MSIISPSMPKIGWKPELVRVMVWNRTGSALRRGEVVAFDLGQTQAETTSALPGNDASAFANVILIANLGVNAGNRYGPFAVTLEPIADDKKGYVALQGLVDAYVFAGTAGAITKGAGLRTAPGQTTFNAGTATTGVCVGIQLGATTASAIDGTTAELVPILFNGVEAFGSGN